MKKNLLNSFSNDVRNWGMVELIRYPSCDLSCRLSSKLVWIKEYDDNGNELSAKMFDSFEGALFSQEASIIRIYSKEFIFVYERDGSEMRLRNVNNDCEIAGSRALSIVNSKIGLLLIECSSMENFSCKNALTKWLQLTNGVISSNPILPAAVQLTTSNGPVTLESTEYLEKVEIIGISNNYYTESVANALELSGMLPDRTGKTAGSMLIFENTYTEADSEFAEECAAKNWTISYSGTH